MADRICNPFDIVEITFPSTSLARSRQRKAIVLSNQEYHEKTGRIILMMLVRATDEMEAFDIPIHNWIASGLRNPCSARVKIITLEMHFVQGYVGTIMEGDRAEILDSLARTTGRACVPRAAGGRLDPAEVAP